MLSTLGFLDYLTNVAEEPPHDIFATSTGQDTRFHIAVLQKLLCDDVEANFKGKDRSEYGTDAVSETSMTCR